jgi:aminoglycoside 3-N-acetyltransferase
MDTASRVRRLMSGVLAVPADAIGPATTFWDTESWTSLSHVELIVAIEEEFGLELSGEQALELLDFETICARLAGGPPAAAGLGRTATVAELEAELRALDLPRGCVLLVHSSLGAVGPLEGGALSVIDALMRTVGRVGGTLVMPAMAGDVEHEDPRSAPTRDMGIIPEGFRRLPGVRRSAHPTGAYAAWGSDADWVVEHHPLDRPEGPDGPLGRVAERDGRVLLVGVGHAANATVHLGEYLAGVPYELRRPLPGREDATVLGIYHCGRQFERLAPALEDAGRVQRVRVGRAAAQCFPVTDVVAAAQRVLARDPLAFLCAPGTCRDCDASRQGGRAG